LAFARLIILSMQPSGGTWRFVDPFDRTFMNRLFEHFLRNFFRSELQGSARVALTDREGGSVLNKYPD